MEPLEVLGHTEEEYISEGQGTFMGDEVNSSGVEVASLLPHGKIVFKKGEGKGGGEWTTYVHSFIIIYQ